MGLMRFRGMDRLLDVRVEGFRFRFRVSDPGFGVSV